MATSLYIASIRPPDGQARVTLAGTVDMLHGRVVRPFIGLVQTTATLKLRPALFKDPDVARQVASAIAAPGSQVRVRPATHRMTELGEVCPLATGDVLTCRGEVVVIERAPQPTPAPAPKVRKPPRVYMPNRLAPETVMRLKLEAEQQGISPGEVIDQWASKVATA